MHSLIVWRFYLAVTRAPSIAWSVPATTN